MSRMNSKMLKGSVVLPLLVCGCAMTMPWSRAGQGGASSGAQYPPPQATYSRPYETTSVQDAGTRETDASFTGNQSTLTQSLDNALDQVNRQHAELQQLERKLGESQAELAAGTVRIEELTKALEASNTRVRKLEDALDKWKQDVLGFRDEMRQAEEAEMQALKEIIVLLKGFKRAKEKENRN